MIINTKNLNEAKKLIEDISKRQEEVIVESGDEEFNRKILENNKIDILILNLDQGKDKLKQRDSGLNEVLCKIAKKNNIKIGIELDKIRKKQGKDAALFLSRLIQNVKLCKRTRTEIKLYGDYDKKDAFSFLITLGASTSQAKKATEP